SGGCGIVGTRTRGGQGAAACRFAVEPRSGKRRGSHLANSASIAWTSGPHSGFPPESNRPAPPPFLPVQNLLKFHFIGPANFGFVSGDVRKWYRGVCPAPLTTTFSVIGNVTP